MTLGTTDWVVFGVCLLIGVCVLALFVASIVSCRRKLKQESNVRKRIVASSNAAVATEAPPEPVKLERRLDVFPAITQPLFIPRPRPLMMNRPLQMQMPSPPQRLAPLPRTQYRDDDWIVIKKIKRRANRLRKKQSDGSEVSSGSYSDGDQRNKITNKIENPRMMPTRFNVPRLNPYGATVPNSGLPTTFSSSGFHGRPTNMALSRTPAQPGFMPLMMPRL